MNTPLAIATFGMCAFVLLGTADAQTSQPSAESEDVEPRIIGSAGTVLMGFSGYADRVFSRSDNAPLNYTLQIDVARFVSDRIALLGGVAGSDSIVGADEDAPEDEDASDTFGTPALHAFGGARLYFTPGSMTSVYAGAEYWTQLTHRESGDVGVVMAIAGAQGVLSSRASLFVEGGYGWGLAGGDRRIARIAGRIGVRLKW